MSNIEWNQIIIGVVSSLLAAGITFLISWLSKFSYVQVPIWIIAIFVALFVFYGYSEYQKRSESLTTIFQKKFGVERIIVDGKHFVECHFDRSELVFIGEKRFSMTRNGLSGVRIKFEGKAALSVTALKAMYNDPALRFYTEAAIQDITQPE